LRRLTSRVAGDRRGISDTLAGVHGNRVRHRCLFHNNGRGQTRRRGLANCRIIDGLSGMLLQIRLLSGK
jgi:hypothetical protein